MAKGLADDLAVGVTLIAPTAVSFGVDLATPRVAARGDLQMLMAHPVSRASPIVGAREEGLDVTGGIALGDPKRAVEGAEEEEKGRARFLAGTSFLKHGRHDREGQQQKDSWPIRGPPDVA